MLVDLIRAAIANRVTPRSAIVLSGGLDSSTVACLASTELPTFTGWYDELGCDERPYARLAAHREHHEIQITPADFVTWFDRMAESRPRVLMGPGMFGQYMVARAIAMTGSVDVVLSGEGSDELFGGYARISKVAGERLPDGYEDLVLPLDYPTSIEGALEYEWRRLPDLLAVDDAMLGAWGLEGRAPFTDQRLVNYALALPAAERVGKRHLRAAVRGIVPDAIIDRTDKMGFPVPFVAWAQREPVRSFVGDRIGYIPDATRPYDRSWWNDMFRGREAKAA